MCDASDSDDHRHDRPAGGAQAAAGAASDHRHDRPGTVGGVDTSLNAADVIGVGASALAAYLTGGTSYLLEKVGIAAAGYNVVTGVTQKRLERLSRSIAAGHGTPSTLGLREGDGDGRSDKKLLLGQSGGSNKKLLLGQ